MGVVFCELVVLWLYASMGRFFKPCSKTIYQRHTLCLGEKCAAALEPAAFPVFQPGVVFVFVKGTSAVRSYLCHAG